MITWATNTEGVTTHISDEWYELTGQQPSEPLGFGWLEVVHPNDRDLVRTSFAEACRDRVEFLLRYRLRRRDGSYIWVIDAAKPSFAPLSHEFLGFLGLVSCFEDDTGGLQAVAEVGSLEPIYAMSKARPTSIIDHVASHLIMARAASVSCTPEVMMAIDNALAVVGQALATELQRRDGADAVH